MGIIRNFIARKRAAGWKQLREQKGPLTMRAHIRAAERCGDFKFMRVGMWCTLLRRRCGHRDTWDFVDQFATRWAARNAAANLVKESSGVLE